MSNKPKSAGAKNLRAARRIDTRTVYMVVNTLTNKIKSNNKLPVKSKNREVHKNSRTKQKEVG